MLAPMLEVLPLLFSKLFPGKAFIKTGSSFFEEISSFLFPESLLKKFTALLRNGNMSALLSENGKMVT